MQPQPRGDAAGFRRVQGDAAGFRRVRRALTDEVGIVAETPQPEVVQSQEALPPVDAGVVSTEEETLAAAQR